MTDRMPSLSPLWYNKLMMQIGTLLLGGIGALLAIYAKEAIQQAFLRRTIAWQLYGYLQIWRAQFIRIPGILPAWNKVKEQEDDLTKAYRSGAAAFEREYTQQSKTRNEIREIIRAKVVEALATPTGLGPITANKTLIAGALEQLRKAQGFMLDSKTFISDRDAAVLGPRAAIHAIKFRTSWMSALSALEMLLSVTVNEGVHKPEESTSLVDSLVKSGEDALVAVVHMERLADEMTKKSILALLRESF